MLWYPRGSILSLLWFPNWSSRPSCGPLELIELGVGGGELTGPFHFSEGQRYRCLSTQLCTASH